MKQYHLNHLKNTYSIILDDFNKKKKKNELSILLGSVSSNKLYYFYFCEVEKIRLNLSDNFAVVYFEEYCLFSLLYSIYNLLSFYILTIKNNKRSNQIKS